MPIELKLNTYGFSTGETIQTYDDTGNYSALTNPGGFGAPNPTRAQITQARIEYTLPYSSQVGAALNTFSTYAFPQTNLDFPLIFPDIYFEDSGITVASITPIAVTLTGETSTVTFNSAHGLNNGDPFVLYDLAGTNVTDYQGGWVVVSVSSPTAVVIEKYSLAVPVVTAGKLYKKVTTTDTEFQDGIYTMKETVKFTDGLTFYSISTVTHVHLQVAQTSCKIDKYTNSVVKQCACGAEANKEWDMVCRLNGMLDAVQAAYNCGQYTTAETILTQLNKILDNDCGCA